MRLWAYMHVVWHAKFHGFAKHRYFTSVKTEIALSHFQRVKTTTCRNIITFLFVCRKGYI
jgi:hypothetical protein